MEFEWDVEKARTNLAKHGIAFEDAIHVWEDPSYVLELDSVQDGEERWWIIGSVGVTTVVVVVHTDRGQDRVRIISARKASKHEKVRYLQQTPR